MDQIQNGQLPEFLKPLIANPAAATQAHRQELEALVQTYPASGIFRLLLAKACQNDDAAVAVETLQAAAVHTSNREILFRLIHQPELLVKPNKKKLYPFAETEVVALNASFIPEIVATPEDEVIPSEKIFFTETYPVEIINTSFTGENLLKDEAVNLDEPSSAEKNNANYIDEKQGEDEVIFSAENLSAEKTDTSFTDEKSLSEPTEIEDAVFINPNPEEAIAAENDLRVEDVNLTFVNEAAEEIVFPMEETIAQHQESEEKNTQPENENASFTNEIDEEVYDEITAIEDIRIEPIKPPVVTEEIIPAVVTEPEKASVEKPALNIQDEAEKDMLSSIAAIDYFTFNNKFGQNQTQLPNAEEKVPENTKGNLENSENSIILAEKEPETVSKYHDEKMPYTFTWWLDRTRKEYAGTYQPYVKSFKAEKTENNSLSVGPELHQQYIESIFHAKPPLEMEENILTPVVEPPVKRKEDQLIERFIIQEPHIHPPSSDKLDTENKAKKSSEDADVLVTETLAKIYLDQMLYHKALDTYKKLLLKFPEKSRYFTSQIELIEEKIN